MLVFNISSVSIAHHLTAVTIAHWQRCRCDGCRQQTGIHILVLLRTQLYEIVYLQCMYMLTMLAHVVMMYGRIVCVDVCRTEPLTAKLYEMLHWSKHM
jgi:hypothetical protein